MSTLNVVVLGACPSIRRCRVSGRAGEDARRRDAGNAGTLLRSVNAADAHAPPEPFERMGVARDISKFSDRLLRERHHFLCRDEDLHRHEDNLPEGGEDLQSPGDNLLRLENHGLHDQSNGLPRQDNGLGTKTLFSEAEPIFYASETGFSIAEKPA